MDGPDAEKVRAVIKRYREERWGEPHVTFHRPRVLQRV